MGPKHNPIMVYQPPLTPVSEAESDATETASISNATTSSTTSSDQSYFYPRPLNFSRPRPVDFSPAHKVHHDRSDSYGTPGATPYAQPRDTFDITQRSSLPDTPTFDVTERSSLPTTPNFAIEFDDAVAGAAEKEVVSPVGQEYSWDEHLKDMRPLRKHNFEEQRSQPRLLYQPTHSSESLPAVELPGSVPQLPVARSKFAAAPELARTRSTSFINTPQPRLPPQTIEEDLNEDDGEDAKSHHTVSDNGEIAELGDPSWMSSTASLESLSEKQIKKLKKKGINPVLYMEMKAARSGRGKWGVNVLSGNAYLS